MRLSYWLDAGWRTPLLIVVIAVLTGLVTYASTTPQPACHLAPAATGRWHYTQVCTRPPDPGPARAVNRGGHA